MTDDHSLDLAPRAEFADRLEDELLRVIGNRAETLPIPDPEEIFVIVERTTMPFPSRRRRWLVPVAAAVIALVAGAVIALARRDHTNVVEPADSNPVTFTIHWAYSDVRHDCPAESGAMCMNHFDFPATSELKGDVVGAGYQGVFWNDPVDYIGQAVDHLEHVGAYNVKATVAGCGTGEFMLMEMMQFKSGADRDRPSGTYIGTWQIVPNSGRGALASISGSGTSRGVFGTAQADGRTFTGDIACP
jgi:hypothetical protein